MVNAPMKLAAFILLVTTYQFLVPGAGQNALKAVPDLPELPEVTVSSGDTGGNIFQQLGSFVTSFFGSLGSIGQFLISLLIYPFRLIPFVVQVLSLDFVDGMPIWVVFPITTINFIGVGMLLITIAVRVLEGGGSVTPFT